MSSEKFEDLEDELKVLHEDITGKITHKIPKLSGGRCQINLLKLQLRDLNISSLIHTTHFLFQN